MSLNHILLKKVPAKAWGLTFLRAGLIKPIQALNDQQPSIPLHTLESSLELRCSGGPDWGGSGTGRSDPSSPHLGTTLTRVTCILDDATIERLADIYGLEHL